MIKSKIKSTNPNPDHKYEQFLRFHSIQIQNQNQRRKLIINAREREGRDLGEIAQAGEIWENRMQAGRGDEKPYLGRRCNFPPME